MSSVIERFKHTYHTLRHDNVAILADLYSADVVFVDPFHRIEGLAELQRYCEELYSNLTRCDFDFHDELLNGDTAFITWTMRYSHPRLKKGAVIDVEGATQIKFADSVYWHRDFIDAGAMLYEHVPILGSVIRTLKARTAA